MTSYLTRIMFLGLCLIAFSISIQPQNANASDPVNLTLTSRCKYWTVDADGNWNTGPTGQSTSRTWDRILKLCNNKDALKSEMQNKCEGDPAGYAYQVGAWPSLSFADPNTRKRTTLELTIDVLVIHCRPKSANQTPPQTTPSQPTPTIPSTPISINCPKFPIVGLSQQAFGSHSEADAMNYASQTLVPRNRTITKNKEECTAVTGCKVSIDVKVKGKEIRRGRYDSYTATAQVMCRH